MASEASVLSILAAGTQSRSEATIPRERRRALMRAAKPGSFPAAARRPSAARKSQRRPVAARLEATRA
jgi:hypothetical protein